MCHVGGTYILRFADSAGVGEGLHPSGPRLLAMASVPCRKRVASRSSAATLDCKVGNQEFVLDSAGVGEGMLVVAGSDSAGVGEGLMVVDSAGVGEGLVLNASMCKWVVLPAYGPSPVLQCMYGTIPIVVDTSRIAQ